MDAKLKEFHYYKAVFLEWRIYKSVNTVVGGLLKQLREKQDEDLDSKCHEGLIPVTLQNEKDK